MRTRAGPTVANAWTRAALSLGLSIVVVACEKPAEAPPTQAPVVEAEPEPEYVPEPEPDPLADLGGDEPDEPAAPKPEPFDVVVEAVMTNKQDGAGLVMVGVDPRFTIHVKIDTVEPETDVPTPGNYDIMLHSPSRTFRGPVPNKGKRVKFELTVYPEDPNDPHDEVFFSSISLIRDR